MGPEILEGPMCSQGGELLPLAHINQCKDNNIDYP